MKLVVGSFLIATILLLLTFSQVSALGEVYIKYLEYSGPGCPSQSLRSVTLQLTNKCIADDLGGMQKSVCSVNGDTVNMVYHRKCNANCTECQLIEPFVKNKQHCEIGNIKTDCGIVKQDEFPKMVWTASYSYTQTGCKTESLDTLFGVVADICLTSNSLVAGTKWSCNQTNWSVNHYVDKSCSKVSDGMSGKLGECKDQRTVLCGLD